MTKEDIVNETVEFYLEDTNRLARSPQGTCYYSYPGIGGKKHCAIGRAMSDEGLSLYGLFSGNAIEVVLDRIAARGERSKAVDTIVDMGIATPEDIEAEPLGDWLCTSDGLDVLDACGETYGLDPLLKEEYKGHPVAFWVDLQDLHDSVIGKVDEETVWERAENILIVHGRD